MRRALIDMQPDRFEDIIALVALYRPGPMANIPTYCARKQGKEQPEYIHPKLEPVLRETFGVIIYQEQVMEAARRLSGYSLGEADLLRRAMGKKIRSEMEAQRKRFVEGAVKDGVEKGQAEAIFELLARFADYGFNKSHAAAYALVAYQTAYMKANYPVEFMAASMTYDMANTDKLAEFRAEAQRLGVKVEPPSINRSGVDVRRRGQHHPLRAGGAERRRPAGGRGDRRGARRPAVPRPHGLRGPGQPAHHQQARAGKPERGRRLRRDREQPRARACRRRRRSWRRRSAGTRTPKWDRASCSAGASMREQIPLPAAEPWLPAGSAAARVRRDRILPLRPSARRLRGRAGAPEGAALDAPSANSVKQGATAGRVAGTVVARAERRTKTGNKMGILEFSDPSGHYEAVIFQEGLQQYRDLLEPGRAVLLMLTAEAQGEDVRARIQTVEPLDQAAEKLQKGLRVFLRSDQPIEGVAKRLEPARSAPDKGDAEISMILILEGGASEVEVKLPGRYKVSPQIAGAIKAVPGVIEVQAM